MGKKNKLQYELDFDFLMWGVNTVLPIYRFAWILNNLFDFKLTRDEDIESPNKVNGKHFFRYYSYVDQNSMFSIEVIDNKSENGPFISELRQVDFLFLVKGELDFFNPSEFSQVLSKIRGVESVLPIDAKLLKSKVNLVLV